MCDAVAGDDGGERWWAAFGEVDVAKEREELLGSLLHAVVAELDLDRGPFAVAGLGDEVHVAVVVVAVVRQRAAEVLQVDAEVADDQAFS